MAATKGDFCAIDSVAAAQGEAWDAWLQTTLRKNLNRLSADKMQPVFMLSQEVADPFNANGLDYAASAKTLRINAPPGAWTYLLEPCIGYVPPGVAEVDIKLRCVMDADVTMYAYAVAWELGSRGMTAGRDIPINFTRASSNVQTITGTGAVQNFPASPSTWRVPVKPSFGRLMGFAIIAQTVRLNIGSFGGLDLVGVVGDATSAWFVDYTSKEIGRPEINEAVTNAPLLESWREDWWAAIYARQDALAIYTFDTSVPSYTSRTAALSTGGAGNARPFPFGPTTAAIDDAFLIAHSRSTFAGLAFTVDTVADWTFAATNPRWEYWNGSAWSALTELVFQIVIWSENKLANVLVLWEMPTDWAASDPSGTGNTGFYVRSHLRQTPTFNLTEPLLDRVWVLETRVPFVGVRDGTGNYAAADDRKLQFKHPIDDTSIVDGSDLYVLGRAETAVIYSLCGMPVQPPTIAG